MKKRRMGKANLSNIKTKCLALRILYFVLDILVLFTMIRALFRGEYSSVFICLLTFALFMLPTTVERNLRLKLPSLFEGIILVFIFAAEILGEINCYYQLVPNWDTVLHTINGFMFAAVGFTLLDIINRKPKIKFKLSPFYFALVAFCFSMTIGVLWEFFEFGSDILVNTDMQKDAYIRDMYTVLLDMQNTNKPVAIEGIEKVIVYYVGDGVTLTQTLPAYIDIGLIDTMKDLFVNFIGALVFSVIGFFYLKSRGKGRLASRFIPVIEEENQAKEKE